MVCQERRIAFGSPSFFVTMYYIKQVFKINRIYGSYIEYDSLGSL